MTKSKLSNQKIQPIQSKKYQVIEIVQSCLGSWKENNSIQFSEA